MDAGNTFLAQLSAAIEWILRVDLTYQSVYAHAEYDNFTVGGEATNYTLMTLGTCVGSACMPCVQFTSTQIHFERYELQTKV